VILNTMNKNFFLIF